MTAEKKKKAKFADLGLAELVRNLDELQKTLVKYRVSSDVSLLEGTAGVVGLRRDIRQLTRLVAQKK